LNGFYPGMPANEVSKQIEDIQSAQGLKLSPITPTANLGEDGFDYLSPISILMLTDGKEMKAGLYPYPMNQTILISSGADKKEIWIVQRLESWSGNGPELSTFKKQITSKFNFPASMLNYHPLGYGQVNVGLTRDGNVVNADDCLDPVTSGGASTLGEITWPGYLNGSRDITKPKYLKRTGSDNLPTCRFKIVLEFRFSGNFVYSYRMTVIDNWLSWRKFYERVELPRQQQLRKKIESSSSPKF